MTDQAVEALLRLANAADQPLTINSGDDSEWDELREAVEQARAALAAAGYRLTREPEVTVEGLARPNDTEILLRWGHMPSCGENAEFPWDCTCDWHGSLDRVLAALRAAEKEHDDRPD